MAPNLLSPSGTTDGHPLASSYERLMALTARNPYGRFADGRPKVPAEVLEQIRPLGAEEIWETLWMAGYQNQFDGNWKILHPERKLVGRAVTAQFMPLRPDVHEVLESDARAAGLPENANQRVIDILQEGDVIVVDLFGKREGGTFVGDILATAIQAATGAGMVVDGAVRDLAGISDLNMPTYVRAVDPTPLHQVMLTGINVPIRVGRTTVMPGDIVFGDQEGVFFVAPELAGKVLERAREARLRDEWTKARLHTGAYRSSDVYPAPKTPELKADFEAYTSAHLHVRAR